MKYYVYFDAYGHARKAISERELAEQYQNEVDQFLEDILKMHLTLKGFVASQFKILEYYRVCSVFESACAAPLNVIYYF